MVGSSEIRSPRFFPRPVNLSSCRFPRPPVSPLPSSTADSDPSWIESKRDKSTNVCHVHLTSMLRP